MQTHLLNNLFFKVVRIINLNTNLKNITIKPFFELTFYYCYYILYFKLLLLTAIYIYNNNTLFGKNILFSCNHYILESLTLFSTFITIWCYISITQMHWYSKYFRIFLFNLWQFYPIFHCYQSSAISLFSSSN